MILLEVEVGTILTLRKYLKMSKSWSAFWVNRYHFHDVFKCALKTENSPTISFLQEVTWYPSYAKQFSESLIILISWPQAIETLIANLYSLSTLLPRLGLQLRTPGVEKLFVHDYEQAIHIAPTYPSFSAPSCSIDINKTFQLITSSPVLNSFPSFLDESIKL